MDRPYIFCLSWGAGSETRDFGLELRPARMAGLIWPLIYCDTKQALVLIFWTLQRLMLSVRGIRKTKSLNHIWDHRTSSSDSSLDQKSCTLRSIFAGPAAQDRFGECTLAVAYVELGICTDDFESASQKSRELPPPCRFVDTRTIGAASERAPAKAIVSLHQPHKVLTVSKELCLLLGYSAEELCGRSIKILQGPRTDATFFHSAIKNAALLSSAKQKTFIYGRDGQEHEVTF